MKGGLNLSKFKKVKEDKDWANLIHQDGHSLMIAKGSLSALHRKQLEKLESYEVKQTKVQHFAEGGEAVAEQSPSRALAAAPETYDLTVAPTVKAIEPTIKEIEAQSNDIQTPERGPAPLQGFEKASKQLQQMGQPGIQFPVKPPTQLETLGQAQKTGLEQEQGAIYARGQAEARQEQAKAKAYEQMLGQLPTSQQVLNTFKAGDLNYKTALDLEHIDPDKYWTGDESTGERPHSRTKALLGVLTSGLGQILGAGQVKENGALDAIDKQIQQEIQLQQNDRTDTMNLWKLNNEIFKNKVAANLSTANQLYTGLEYQLKAAIARTQGPIAIQNANIAAAKIQQLKDANNFKLSLLNPTSDNPDPASRVQYLVPPEKQRDVLEEIRQAEDTLKAAPAIFEAFDKAAKEARPFTGGFSGTSGSAFTPNIGWGDISIGIDTPAQKQLKVLLGPTFQDKEGTVNQSAMNTLFTNIKPQFLDGDANVARKRQSLEEYIKSKSSAPTAKAFGIDLSKFPKTDTSQIGKMEQRIINGKPYMVPVGSR